MTFVYASTGEQPPSKYLVYTLSAKVDRFVRLARLATVDRSLDLARVEISALAQPISSDAVRATRTERPYKSSCRVHKRSKYEQSPKTFAHFCTEFIRDFIISRGVRKSSTLIESTKAANCCKQPHKPPGMRTTTSRVRYMVGMLTRVARISALVWRMQS
jgi:hypothetical protein